MLKGQYPEFQQKFTEIMQIMQQLPDATLKADTTKISAIKGNTCYYLFLY